MLADQAVSGTAENRLLLAMTPDRFVELAGSLALYVALCAQAGASGNPVPSVVGPVIPQAAVPGSGAFTLKVYGANFVSGAVVNWNRQPKETTFISGHELQAQILASDVAKATAGYVTVSNPPPGGGVSSSSYAIVEVHQPTKTISVIQPVEYSDGGNEYVITADIRGRGVLDLVAGGQSGEVTANLGNGDGTFQPAYTIGKGYDVGASAVAFGDFNNDGNLDLVSGWNNNLNGDPPSHLRVLLGNGVGGFKGLPRFGRLSTGHARGIVVGDFNRDGILDLAVASDGGDYGNGLFLGNGDGTFKHVRHFYQLPGGGDDVGADFNGDGNLDVVLEYGHGLYLLLGNGDGTFQKQRQIAWDEHSPGACNAWGQTLLVGDFNTDGNADLAFCDRNTNGYVRIGIVLGNGDGTFQPPAYYPTGFGPQGVVSFAVGDFNSDGKTDIITAFPGDNGPPEFKVFWGNGDGTFQKGQKINIPCNLECAETGLIPGDFNSDGLLDFVMGDVGDLQVYIQK